MDAKQKEITHTLSGGQGTANLYDDGNIPDEDLKEVIPDEVPRKDGPGGEGSCREGSK